MDQSFSATDFTSAERIGNSGRKKRGVTSAAGTRVSTSEASEKTNDGTTCRSQRTVRKDRRTEGTVFQRRASSNQHRHEKEGNAASLEESVGEVGFRERAEIVIERGLVGFLGTKSVGFSGDQF